MTTLSLNKSTSSKRLDSMRKKVDPVEHNNQQQAERKRKIRLAYTWLYMFPVFQKCLLLKIGIHKDIKEALQKTDHDFGLNHVKVVLQSHVKSARYQDLDKYGQRYTLDAQKVDINDNLCNKTAKQCGKTAT